MLGGTSERLVVTAEVKLGCTGEGPGRWFATVEPLNVCILETGRQE